MTGFAVLCGFNYYGFIRFLHGHHAYLRPLSPPFHRGAAGNEGRMPPRATEAQRGEVDVMRKMPDSQEGGLPQGLICI